MSYAAERNMSMLIIAQKM